MQNRPLAITCGDPAGIGPEVIARGLQTDIALAKNCVVIGPPAWLAQLTAISAVPTVAVGAAAFALTPGSPSPASARIALAAMQEAAAGCRQGRYAGVVTGPVSKARLQQVGFAHCGQTEYLATQWGGAPTMAFVGEDLCIVLGTWHLPLRAVPAALTPQCITLAIERAVSLGQQLGVATPRIGVCGLNPHAGEDGLLGTEELTVIEPQLARLRQRYPGVSPCLPADTLFWRQRQGEFDVVVAWYHDQALGPMKTLEFDKAVNVTLGLPWVRTSPDHGTAFACAGRGQANPSSFLCAVRLARRLIQAKGVRTEDAAVGC